MKAKIVLMLSTAAEIEQVGKLLAPMMSDEPAPADEPVRAATGPAGGESATVESTPPEPAPAADANGVAFNREFCAESADPFYTSGKRRGQWKKRRGVDDAAYDGWYAVAAATVVALAEENIEPAEVFAGTPPPPPAEGFTTPAELMAWVAEQQANGAVNAEQVQAAYATAGVQLNDLFPPATPEDVATRVAAVHAEILKHV